MPSLLQNSSAEILIDFKKTYELVIQLVTLPLQSTLKILIRIFNFLTLSPKIYARGIFEKLVISES